MIHTNRRWSGESNLLKVQCFPLQEGDGPVAGGMTILKRFIGQSVPLSDGTNATASRNRTPSVSPSSATTGAAVSSTAESLVEEYSANSGRESQHDIRFGGYADGENVESDGEVKARRRLLSKLSLGRY